MGKKSRGAPNELSRLLSPVTPATFLSRHWAKRALHVRGRPRKFHSLFDLERFWRAVDAIGTVADSSRAHVRAFYDRDILPAGARSAYAWVDGPGARDAFARGATLCVSAISDVDDALRAFVRAIKAQLHYPGATRFNAYYSPAGRGLPFHFDARVTCSLQISGAKTWTFTPKAAVTWPRGNADLTMDGAVSYFDGRSGQDAWERPPRLDRATLESVTLHPGDVLFLPAGAWHTASGRSESLALNLAFEPIRPLELLCEVLDPMLRSDPHWRSVPPALTAGDALPAATARFLQTRVRELGRALSGLDVDGDAFLQVWRRRLKG
jgi:ribosomal protein L16 Arg81 hydroxylase